MARIDMELRLIVPNGGETVRWSISQSTINQPVNQSLNQPFILQLTHPMNQSFDRSLYEIGHTVRYHRPSLMKDIYRFWLTVMFISITIGTTTIIKQQLYCIILVIAYVLSLITVKLSKMLVFVFMSFSKNGKCYGLI